MQVTFSPNIGRAKLQRILVELTTSRHGGYIRTMNSEGTRPAGNRGAHRAGPHAAAAAPARSGASSQGLDLTSLLRNDHSLQQIVDDGMAVLEADAAVIEVREGDAWRVVFQRGLAATDTGVLLSSEKAPVAARVAASLAPVAIADFAQSAHAQGSYLLERGARWVVAAPLVVPDEPLAVVIFMVRGDPGDSGDPSDRADPGASGDPGERSASDVQQIRLVEEIATQATAAVRTALLSEAERRTSRRLTDILDSMNDGFVSLDHEWRYIIVNRAAEALAKRPAAELLGQSMEKLYPNLPSWPYYREVVAEQRPVRFETWSPVLEVWLEIHAYPTSEGISILFTDISERKSAEQALAQTRDLLDAHIDNSPLAVVEFDSEFRIVRWSNGAERMFGWTAEEVLGIPIAELRWVYEEDVDLVIAESARLLSGERPRSLNINRNYRKDGSVIWCEWYSSAVYDEDGRLVSVLSQVLDVTGRKTAEQALRDSEQKYRSLFGNMTEEVHFWQVVRGESGEIVTWRLVDANPPTLKTWGFEDVEEIRGKTPDEILGPGATENYMAVVRKVMEKGAPQSFEDYFPNLDKWFRFTTVGFGDYFITTGADVTEIKRTRDDLERAQAVASVGSWRLNTRRDELTWSSETYRMYGVPDDAELSYESFLTSVHPDDRAHVDESWQAALRQEREYDIEHRIVLGDEIKWVRERAELEFDGAGGLLGGFGTVQDITRLKTVQTQLEWTAQRLELLAESARLLLAADRPEEAVQEVAERVCTFLDCDVFFNYLMQEDRKGMLLNAYTGISEATAESLAALRLGDAVCGCVGRDGERIVAEDIRNSSDERTDLVRSLGVQAYACHPLIVRDETIGTLSFGTRTRARFADDELELMCVVADQAATAMARKRAEDRLRMSRESLAAERTRLRSIIDNVPIGITLLDEQGVVVEVNRANREIWGDGAAAPGTGALASVHKAFDPQTHEVLEAENWPAARTLRTGERSEKLAEIERLGGSEATIKLTAAPISDDWGTVSGVVELTEDVTTVVEEQRLNEALAEVATMITGTLDTGEIMRRLVRPSVLALKTETGALSLYEGERWVIEEFFGPTKRKPTSSLTDRQLESTVLAAKRPEPIAIHDVEADERVSASAMRRLGIRSLLVVPLVVQNAVVGVLGFAHRQKARPFSPAQVDFARKLIATASLALENARLYERERRIAETLQEAILAPLPELEGLDSSYLYRPASEAAAVGGDFYDLFEIPGGRIGILVGDVSGKGLEAARLTSLVRDGVRAYAYERSDPAWVLERLNGLVYRSTQIGEFATVFFAVLDPEFDRLAYCSAGHPAAALCHDDSVRMLDDRYSPIVGAFPMAEYSTSEVEFVSGDRLTLYTDGVTEARSDGEQFGDTRLMGALRKLRKSRIEKVPQALLDEVQKFTGGPLPDDIVIMVVGRAPRKQ